MMKDFNGWNNRKKNIEGIKHSLDFQEGQIWWCSIGLNVGEEQDGKNSLFERPILVLKKFNHKICWVLPISSKNKLGRYYYSIVDNDISYTILLSQLKLISAKRFRRLIKRISGETVPGDTAAHCRYSD